VSYAIVLSDSLREELRTGVTVGEVGSLGKGQGPNRVNSMVTDVDGDGWNELVLGSGRRGVIVCRLVPDEVE
jgi:hypothetical protein